jgi:acyl-CoA thioester hydrolase
MRVAYHGEYLAFFETGRVEAFRQVGMLYSTVVERGLHLAVVEAQVRYLKPAVFDDLLLVSTHLADLGRATFSLTYCLEREPDRALLATGRTVHACVDATSLRPTRLPGWLLEALRLLEPA